MTNPIKSRRTIPSAARYNDSADPERETSKNSPPFRAKIPRLLEFPRGGKIYENAAVRVDSSRPRNRIDPPSGPRRAFFRGHGSAENEILIFKPRHDTISVISIEATVGRRTRDA